MTANPIAVETDLNLARRALAARVAELRAARQQVRDAEALVASKRKSRLLTGRN